MEEWRLIPGYEPYEASSEGRIRRDGHVLKVQTVRDYFRLQLTIGGVKYDKPVHQLVCLAFHGLPPNPNDWALHKDDSNKNNIPNNLYWGTPKHNSEDRARNGHNPNTVLNWDKVREIRARVKAGEKPFAIQGEYGISNATIHNIVHNKSWKEVVYV